MRPKMMSPVMVITCYSRREHGMSLPESFFCLLTLIEANQNSHSPYTLAPNKLMTITTIKHIVYASG